jgi:hypothetical protein
MNDINPYQPPKQLSEEKVSPSVKQVVGVGTILLLTPFAVGVAFFASCMAVEISVDPIGKRWGLDAAVPWGLAIFFLPPLATLVGMIVWAVRVYGRRQGPGETGSKREPG